MEIKVQSLYQQFGEQEVLRNITMEISKGDILCIMGPSGCGKTTLLQILMGIRKPSKGVVEGLEGKRISAVFQEDRLINHWDAIENIALVVKRREKELEIRQHLQEVGIMDVEGKSMKEFSGGMKRRVAIVRAMMADSDIIYMDEPFKGLDEGLKMQLINYVLKYRKDRTLIIVTHDRDEVEYVNGKLLLLESI